MIGTHLNQLLMAHAHRLLGQDEVPGLIALSEAKSTVNKKIHQEGIVVRPLVEASDPELGRLSFKVINPRFLLKYE